MHLDSFLKINFAIFDDSRSPLLYDNWVHPNLNGKCDALSTDPCFGADFNPGGYRYANETACISAGCCWHGRESSDFIDLAWWSDGVENVLTTSKFPLPSNYKIVHSVFNGPPVGQLHKNNNTGKYLFPFKLWRKSSSANSSYVRHYTTASIAGEKDAIKTNFKFVGILGYISSLKAESNDGASQQVKLFIAKKKQMIISHQLIIVKHVIRKIIRLYVIKDIYFQNQIYVR